jgi:hypothetical protein
MCIRIGVQFFTAKVAIYKAFSILFNENRLCGGVKITAEGPVSLFGYEPFNERALPCAQFNYSFEYSIRD